MILEIASFFIRPGHAPDFEKAFLEASKVIAAAEGHCAHQLQRSVDIQNHYVLLVQWRTREDHMVGFRQSPLFVQWRGLLGQFFASAPEVEHYQLLASVDSTPHDHT